MNRGFLITVLFLAVGVGMYHYLQPQNSGSANNDVLFDVMIQGSTMDPPIIRVNKNTQVAIEFRTDEEGVVEVDDYDATAVVAMGRVVTMNLFAGKVGVFPVYIRLDSAPTKKIRIGTIEVSEPKRAW